MERETGLEPATSSLGKRISIVNRGVRRSRRSFLVKKVLCFQQRVSTSHRIEVIEVTISSAFPLTKRHPLEKIEPPVARANSSKCSGRLPMPPEPWIRTTCDLDKFFQSPQLIGSNKSLKSSKASKAGRRYKKCTKISVRSSRAPALSLNHSIVSS